MRFGRLIGAGQAGFVFQNMDNPKHYYKLVALPRSPISEYPVRSLDRNLYAVNTQQAKLFQRLFQSGNQPSALPEVYSFTEGIVDPSIRRQLITSSEDFNWQDEITELLRVFRTGQPYAIWEMEAIPCTDVNDYCERYDGSKIAPLENSDYQQLLKYLLTQGFVVRDIRNPENFGFRENGSQVFFDPVVSSWPVDASDPESMAAFTGTFGNDLVTVQRALDSGDYFNWYHGQAIMQSEEEADLPIRITTAVELQKFWKESGLYQDDDDELFELLINEQGVNITKYPQYLAAINWISNQEELANEMKVSTSKVLREIWDNFVDFWDEEFSELWYGERYKTNSYNAEPVSQIFELIQQDFTLSQVVRPMTTILFRIVNDPAAFKELTDSDLAETLLENVLEEQDSIRKLCLESGKGNSRIIIKAFYDWVRGSAKMGFKSGPYKINTRTGRKYLPSFTPPSKDLIHYESLYDSRSGSEVDSILRNESDMNLDDYYITWDIYLDDLPMDIDYS